MDKKTWDQAHTVPSNNAQERKRKIAGTPTMKTQGLEFKDVNKETKDNKGSGNLSNLVNN